MAPIVASKVDLKPKRHHGYAVLLFIMGTLFPPLAVAARFGIGKDFWLNLLLTICGYIPGHGHNFYIQNIRNNKTHARTPKWAQRYGLVDTSTIERHQRRSQWANRYNDRLPHSTLEDEPYAEGQEQASSVDLPSTENGGLAPRQTNGELWRPEDEQYYNANSESSSGGGRWHYPANFEDAVAPKQSKKGKKEKKDRWARTEDAYSMSEETGRKKKSKKSKKKKGAEDQSFTNDSYVSRDSSTTEFPEDAEGGLYGDRRRGNAENGDSQPSVQKQTTDDVFTHQF